MSSGPMSHIVNFLLLAIAGCCVGAGLRATKVRAPKRLIRALYSVGLISLALAITLT